MPGRHPVEHLTSALGSKLAQPLEHIQQDLAKDRTGQILHRLAGQFPGEHVVLYIDQFEELFTLTTDEGERQQFVNLITSAAAELGGKLIVLLSMRADFLDRPLNYATLGQLFNMCTELVPPLSISEMRDAIEKPARSVGLTFEPDLVAEIIFTLRTRNHALAGAPPLMQYTLRRLFLDQVENRLTWDAYKAMGGVEGAIGTHSEAVFCTLPDGARSKLGAVFLPLINLDEDTGEPTRRRAPLDRLTTDSDSRLLVEALVKNRLLQIGCEDGRTFLEVAHEALFSNWVRLAEWISATRGDLLLLKELKKAARTWDEHDRDHDFLWVGEHGQEMLRMLDRLQPDLDEVERAFARPEHVHLLDEIADIATPHHIRDKHGFRLYQLGHVPDGAGLRADGLPEIFWCFVDVPEHLRGKEIEFKDNSGKVYSKTTLQPFEIAKYLITHMQFRVFVEQGNDNPEWWRGIRRKECAEARQPYSIFPRDMVSWYEAVAFCRWLSQALGQRIELPTEQQWQWAAQNGLERRAYPWPGGWDRRCCNTSEAGVGRSTAVGMYPHGAAACGAMDMSGNLWEWCLNKYDDPEVTAIDDTNELRAVRGGASNFNHYVAHASFRRSYNPNDRVSNSGFRVVRILYP